MIFIAIFYDGKRGGKRSFEQTGFRNQIARFDLAGTLAFISATICLLLALSWGGTKYPWDNARIIALLTVACVLYFSFIGIEYWKKDNAIIPLRLLRRRSIGAAIWFGICLGGVFFVSRSNEVDLTLYLADQSYYHYPRSMCFIYVSIAINWHL